MKNCLFLVSFLLLNTSLWGQYPYQNPDLGSEDRARDLISRLTLEEKASLMCD